MKSECRNFAEDDSNEEDEGDFFSTIMKEEPKVGMKLEIRDSDYIWSSGTIKKVTKQKLQQTSRKKNPITKTRKIISRKKIEKWNKIIQVTVASDGWGREWDEIIEWPNERLAKLYTYTKEVKCFLDLLKKSRKRGSIGLGIIGGKATTTASVSKQQKSNHYNSTLWPICVQFRMPHPGVKHARNHLRLEDKLFIRPYGVHLLPSDIRDNMMIHDGGCWFHHSRLRLWRDDLKHHHHHYQTDNIYHPNFTEAFQLGQADMSVPGVLLPKALEHNSLLKDRYRVHNVRGCSELLLDGRLRDTMNTTTIPTRKGKEHSSFQEEIGLILPPKIDKQRLDYNLVGDDEEVDDDKMHSQNDHQLNSSSSSNDNNAHDCTDAIYIGEQQNQQPPSVVAIHKNDIDTNSEIMLEEPEVCEAPELPTPIFIKTPLYPKSGVQKCKKSNNWIASVSRNRNQVFLDTFPTESQAWIATRKATNTNNNKGNDSSQEIKMPRTLLEAQKLDLEAVTMEHIIDAYETQYDPTKHNFSLHEWTLRKIHHICYLKEKKAYGIQKKGGQQLSYSKTAAATPPPLMMITPSSLQQQQQQLKNQRKNKRKGLPTKIVRAIEYQSI